MNAFNKKINKKAIFTFVFIGSILVSFLLLRVGHLKYGKGIPYLLWTFLGVVYFITFFTVKRWDKYVITYIYMFLGLSIQLITILFPSIFNLLIRIF
jgi:hypothetical protein